MPSLLAFSIRASALSVGQFLCTPLLPIFPGLGEVFRNKFLELAQEANRNALKANAEAQELRARAAAARKRLDVIEREYADQQEEVVARRGDDPLPPD